MTARPPLRFRSAYYVLSPLNVFSVFCSRSTSSLSTSLEGSSSCSCRRSACSWRTPPYSTSLRYLPTMGQEGIVNFSEVVMNLYKSQLTFIFHNKSNTFMHEIYVYILHITVICSSSKSKADRQTDTNTFTNSHTID